MEVGAVKQAFNNEVILLKKNLQQAKIQVIHKLTRKAKTLTDKKAPDPVKEKFKRKAELAVKEVLVIKKIKARNVARFIVTHKGNLNEYLNKPIVDENKGCARLLLHKSMTNKYNLMRNKFGNVSINDLLMSRQERRKLKKEARDKQKEKKKKGNADKIGGDWNVEKSDNSKVILDPGSKDVSGSSDDEYKSDGQDNSETDIDENENANDTSAENHEIDQKIITDDESEESDEEDISQTAKKLVTPDKISDNNRITTHDIKVFKEKKTKKIKKKLNDQINQNFDKKAMNKKALNKDISKEQPPETLDTLELSLNITKKANKKLKEGNKNKNLNEKLLKRNFNTKTDDEPVRKVMVADPFFVTSTGDSYMSLVEPRQPDELKEEHKTGNRKYRRAVMFGNVPVPKVRKNNVAKETKYNNFNDKSEERHSKFNSNKFNQEKPFRSKDDKEKINDSSVPEKLHPSWEAKKRQSSILPFKGKKILFDE